MGAFIDKKRLTGVTAAAATTLLIFAIGCGSSGQRQKAEVAPSPPPPGAVASSQVREPAEIRSLELGEDGRLLELVADRPLVWTSFRDTEGDLVIELPNSVPSASVDDLSRDLGLVAGVDVELLDDSDRPLTRLVVKTREPSEHSLAGDGETLRIQLLPVSGDRAAALAYEPLPAEEPEEPEEPEMASAPAPPPAPETRELGTAESPLQGPPATGVAASQLYDVEIRSADGETVVEVAGDGEFEYSTFHLENPERFVIDLSGVVNNSPTSVVPVGSDHVEQIRIGQFKPRPEPVSRVVFDLRRMAPPRIERTSDGLLVTFGAGAAGVTLAEEMGAAEPMAEEAMGEPMAEEMGEPEPGVAVAEAGEAPPMAEEAEPPFTGSQEMEPEMAEAESPPEVVAPAVPVYRPEEEAEPEMAASPPMVPTDVASFEAQEVQVEEPEDTTERILESFGTLVVNRQEREYVGEPIDMSLKQADLVETLRSFATISDLNFVIQPGVSGSVTVELRGVPWDQAMEQILKINNLGMDIDGTIVRIAPMAQLRAEAEEQRRLQQARQQSVPLRTVMKSLSYSNAQQIAALLRNRTGSILSSRGTVQVDDRTNTLIIRELPGTIDTVLAVIENLDQPEPQVTIEARIIEATKQFSRSLGIEWGYDYAANQANGNTTGLTFPNNIDTDGRVPLLTGGATGFINLQLGSILNTFNLDVRLQVAENEGLVNLVSAPRVTTLNNTPAQIQSGVQIPIQTVSNRTVSVQFVNATLQLQVTPQVTAEGTIMMDINVAKRSPAPGLAIVGSTNSPIQTREARTKVIVRDGATTVIGGIYEVSANNSQDRVPGVSNIPILGHLFKNRNKSNSNDELMIFITPRIVQM
jgi:type IV pilus assembly protein PilQ